MAWSKTKQQLESFLCPALVGIVEYRASSYRYTPDKSGHCYLTVNKQEVCSMNEKKSPIPWFWTEQEIKSDPELYLPITEDEINTIRAESKGSIPEDRLAVIAGTRIKSAYAKQILLSQNALAKSDFQKTAILYLSSNIEDCLSSDDIMLNILAIIDRRVGKKRLINMRDIMLRKHPLVRYFYNLRPNSSNTQ